MLLDKICVRVRILNPVLAFANDEPDVPLHRCALFLNWKKLLEAKAFLNQLQDMEAVRQGRSEKQVLFTSPL
jgi:hypothetical protein